MPTPASPEPRRYRGALIGAGGIARQSHLPALRGAPALQRRLEVVALVDSAADVPPVDTLPLLYRETARLYYLEERSYREIAQRTALPESTVKIRLYRARVVLREALKVA